MLSIESDFAGSDMDMVYKNINILQTKGSVFVCSMFFPVIYR